VHTPEQKAQAEHVLRTVRGVTAVENAIRVVLLQSV